MSLKQVISSLVSIFFDSPQLDTDILNFKFLENDNGRVSSPHFFYDFSRKMFHMLYSIN